MLEFTVDKEKFVCLLLLSARILSPSVYIIIKSKQESLVQFCLTPAYF